MMTANANEALPISTPCFVGIDIGVSGGIAAIIVGAPIPAIWEMPTFERTLPPKKGSKTGKVRIRRELDSTRVRSIFAQLRAQYSEIYVMIERPQLRPAMTFGSVACPVCKQPKVEKGQGLASQAKFLGQYERIAGILEGLGIAFEDVHPATWKADVFHGASDKTDARMKASQLYPGIANKLTLKKSDGLAESILLADYGKRRRYAPF